MPEPEEKIPPEKREVIVLGEDGSRTLVPVGQLLEYAKNTPGVELKKVQDRIVLLTDKPLPIGIPLTPKSDFYPCGKKYCIGAQNLHRVDQMMKRASKPKK